MESGEEDFRPYKLMRCTSTPMAGGPSSKPAPRFPKFDVSQEDETDSGFITDLSGSSPSLSTATGAVPKMATVRRHRTRSTASSSSSQGSSPFLTPNPVPCFKRKQKMHTESLRSRDIHIPQSESSTDDGGRSRASSTSSSGSRIVYSPGLFCGREKMDFIRRLSDMQASHVLDNIWMELTVEDLCSAMQVSSLWNATVKSSASSHKRWTEAKEMWTENDSGPGSRTRLRKTILLKTSPRKALGNVSNVIVSVCKAVASSSPLTSPSKFRHRLFADEASGLMPGEQLRSCPRCTSPSKVGPTEMRAECTRISCQFIFCTKCMCEYHADGTGCRAATGTAAKSLSFSSRPKKVATASSKTKSSNIISSGKSKSRLKRL